ncbi:MAG: hypothetical protein OEM82_06035 [Acidobacteriota bacterium]|nr:hypothetical protein [Acidobacteriota bacterium]MDH3529226.1 hypothetical protein [Acidobacteriota bacterium]
MNCLRTQIISIFVFAAACGPAVGPPEKSTERNSGGPGGGTFAGGSSESGKRPKEVNPAVKSIYSDLAEDTCIEDEISETEGWSVRSCKGVEGYRLLVSEGDLRQSADVVTPDGKRFKLEFPAVVSSAFSTVGDKAEWRVTSDKGKNRPVALIIRYNVNDDPNDTEKITSYLTVSKISEDAACVTDVVKPVKNANLAARNLADSASERPCLKRNP